MTPSGRRHRSIREAGAIALLLATACTAQSTQATVGASRNAQSSRVTASTPSTEPNAVATGSPTATTPINQSAQPSAERCTSDSVRALVTKFLAAFNAGDERTLDAVWAPAGAGWEWYSTDGAEPRFEAVARDRSGLIAFFARRYAKHESLRLTSFKFNGSAGRGDFEYTLLRQADDLKSTVYLGKGSAECTSPPLALAVWSMARDPSK
ncbi:MAG: nuclear transport factor 2 family protein [Actinomycetota bacterium]